MADTAGNGPSANMDLNGKITDHHRFLLGIHLENIDHLAKQIEKMDEEIERKKVPF
jgi:hypothetical protein